MSHFCLDVSPDSIEGAATRLGAFDAALRHEATEMTTR